MVLHFVKSTGCVAARCRRRPNKSVRCDMSPASGLLRNNLLLLRCDIVSSNTNYVLNKSELILRSNITWHTFSG